MAIRATWLMLHALVLSAFLCAGPMAAYGLAPASDLDETLRASYRKYLLFDDTSPEDIARMLSEKLYRSVEEAKTALLALWNVGAQLDKLEDGLRLLTIAVQGEQADKWKQIVIPLAAGYDEKAQVFASLYEHLYHEDTAGPRAVRPLTESQRAVLLPPRYRLRDAPLRIKLQANTRRDPVRHFLTAYGFDLQDADAYAIGGGYALTPWDIPSQREYQKIFALPPREDTTTWVLSRHSVPIGVLASEPGRRRLSLHYFDMEQARQWKALSQSDGTSSLSLHKVYRHIDVPEKLRMQPESIPIFPGVYEPDMLYSAAMITALLNELGPKGDIETARPASGPPEAVLVGSGSGADVAVLAHNHPTVRIMASDVQPLAVANTRLAAELGGFSHRLELRLADGFPSLPQGKRVRYILGNLPGVSSFANRSILYPEGLSFEDVNVGDDGGRFLLSILEGTLHHLAEDGVALLMVSPSNWARHQVRKRGLSPDNRVFWKGSAHTLVYRLTQASPEEAEGRKRDWLAEALRYLARDLDAGDGQQDWISHLPELLQHMGPTPWSLAILDLAADAQFALGIAALSDAPVDVMGKADMRAAADHLVARGLLLPDQVQSFAPESLPRDVSEYDVVHARLRSTEPEKMIALRERQRPGAKLIVTLSDMPPQEGFLWHEPLRGLLILAPPGFAGAKTLQDDMAVESAL